jgi:hypothetical protein
VDTKATLNRIYEVMVAKQVNKLEAFMKGQTEAETEKYKEVCKLFMSFV